ncbi:cyclic GMP-AMP synthase isoform X1 [Parambassis ranga]|uniref:Cyclic GMP-AMP synthase isoform X1 n=2 Tax=Parambassis ranga TaxID=210632 RepID=A0A6P7HMP6_9TELE|nr:cyclic GMP-AMP synthase-like isoform X1 [Parambassis ranga]
MYRTHLRLREMGKEDTQTEATQHIEDVRGEPGAMSPRQRQKDELLVFKEEVANESPSVPAELANWIKLNAKDLKIRQKDRCWAAEVVNDFRENLLRFLKSSTDQPFFQNAEFLNTGSYFEKVKIHSPDEFDMMLKLQVRTRLSLSELDGGLFYRISLIRPTRTPVQAFLLENKLTLSSSKVLSEMYRLVRKFLKTYKVPDTSYRWEVNRKRPYSPAVTLSLYRREDNSDELISVDVVPALEVQSWPCPARNGPDVDNWLGKKVWQEIKGLPCFFVPKRLKGRNLSEDAKESWRISFSHIEKKIMMSHGNKKTCCESAATKCCRKQCLMLLKSLIEGLKQRFPKELDRLCSYHGKTAFLHTLCSRFKDSMWSPQKLPTCFMHLVGALEDHAHRADLPHFFVPECNLFSSASFPRRALLFLYNALGEQRREGLPLLRPPAPVPSLIPETVSAETFSERSTERSVMATVDSGFMKLVLVFAVAFMCTLFFET